MIHPTAIISPQATLDPSVEVGPYAVIDAGVSLGANCVVGPHAYLTGVTVVGPGNHFHAGCVIGDAPQDLKYDGTPTRLRIGERNVFREHVTIHRSTTPDGETLIGNGNLLMAGSHVGHNCCVGNHIIMANGALLGGHVQVFDRAFISGNCGVHQFVRVGSLAMMQGGALLTKDLPPFTILHNVNELCGLNSVGLRRAGMPAEERMELKRLYRLLFRSGKNLRQAAAEAASLVGSATARQLLEFLAASKRGVCVHRGATPETGD
jgi:UDP-N-acetylglucosamine acyltransferase